MATADLAPELQAFLQHLAVERRLAARTLALYTQAAALQGADTLPLDHRIGIALQQLGRTDAARAALQRFVAAGKGPKANLDDAKQRLAQLGT